MLENMSEPVKAKHAHTAWNDKTNPGNFRRLSKYEQ